MKCHLILPQRRGAGISFSTREPSAERQKIKKKKKEKKKTEKTNIRYHASDNTGYRNSEGRKGLGGGECERKGENERVSEFGA